MCQGEDEASGKEETTVLPSLQYIRVSEVSALDLGFPALPISVDYQGSWPVPGGKLVVLWPESWCGNLLRCLKFYTALNVFFSLNLCSLNLGVLWHNSGHPDLITALSVIIKNGAFSSTQMIFLHSWSQGDIKYSWPLNAPRVNCMDLLIHGFF